MITSPYKWTHSGEERKPGDLSCRFFMLKMKYIKKYIYKYKIKLLINFVIIMVWVIRLNFNNWYTQKRLMTWLNVVLGSRSRSSTGVCPLLWLLIYIDGLVPPEMWHLGSWYPYLCSFPSTIHIYCMMVQIKLRSMFRAYGLIA